MREGIQRLAHRGDVAAHAGRGFVMRHQQRLDCVAVITGQPFGELRHRRAATPGAFDDLDLEAVTLAQVDPAMRKHAVAGDQYLVTR